MANKKFPKLFKRNSKGTIQEWQISVVGTTIVTTHGQVGGKIQKTSDFVKTGKNEGRKNATTAQTQAVSEAESKWLKQKKAGYTESHADAVAGKTDKIIEGGIVPMLAKVFEDHQEDIKYPVMVQPKLDGHRCVAVFDSEGKVTLWTRTRKPIKSVPHIVSELERVGEKLKLRSIALDGELYNHKFKDDFEKLTSLARKEQASLGAVQLQYHVYDVILPIDFESRLAKIADLIILGGSALHLVATVLCDTEPEVMAQYDQFKKEGYEGAMIRQLGIPYETKRSSQLLKMKGFIEKEFVITGVKEGRGKLANHGIFKCETEEMVGFDAKLSGPTARLEEIWRNRNDYIGQVLTVKFQGLTKDGSPRFPVGLRVREDL